MAAGAAEAERDGRRSWVEETKTVATPTGKTVEVTTERYRRGPRPKEPAQ